MRQIPIWLVLMITACGQPTQTSTAPPGFTDDPPPPPVSDTVILSGGTLVAAEPISDSLIVITRGRLVNWGQRGSVDVPNDSIGRDMRGKWIMAGHVRDGQPVPDPALLQSGAPANLLILNDDPTGTLPGADRLAGYAIDGELHLPESD